MNYCNYIYPCYCYFAGFSGSLHFFALSWKRWKIRAMCGEGEKPTLLVTSDSGEIVNTGAKRVYYLGLVALIFIPLPLFSYHIRCVTYIFEFFIRAFVLGVNVIFDKMRKLMNGSLKTILIYFLC